MSSVAGGKKGAKPTTMTFKVSNNNVPSNANSSKMLTIPMSIQTSYESDGTTPDDSVKGSSAYDSDDSAPLSSKADSMKGRKSKKGASASDSEDSDSSSKGTSVHDLKKKGASTDSKKGRTRQDTRNAVQVKKGASASDSEDSDSSSKGTSVHDLKKSRTRQEMKKAVRQKKEKKRKIVEVQEDEDAVFFADCIATAKKEKKEMVKRAKQANSFLVESDSEEEEEEPCDAAKPVKEKAKATTSVQSSEEEEGGMYLAFLNDDTHVSVVRRIIVADEEFTPSKPMIGRIIALVGVQKKGESAPRMMILDEKAVSLETVPRVNFGQVASHYQYYKAMPDAGDMVMNEDDNDKWRVPRLIEIPQQL